MIRWNITSPLEFYFEKLSMTVDNTQKNHYEKSDPIIFISYNIYAWKNKLKGKNAKSSAVVNCARGWRIPGSLPSLLWAFLYCLPFLYNEHVSHITTVYHVPATSRHGALCSTCAFLMSQWCGKLDTVTWTLQRGKRTRQVKGCVRGLTASEGQCLWVSTKLCSLFYCQSLCFHYVDLIFICSSCGFLFFSWNVSSDTTR